MKPANMTSWAACSLAVLKTFILEQEYGPARVLKHSHMDHLQSLIKGDPKTARAAAQNDSVLIRRAHLKRVIMRVSCTHV
jgi:hypothetical protein